MGFAGTKFAHWPSHDISFTVGRSSFGKLSAKVGGDKSDNKIRMRLNVINKAPFPRGDFIAFELRGIVVTKCQPRMSGSSCTFPAEIDIRFWREAAIGPTGVE